MGQLFACIFCLCFLRLMLLLPFHLDQSVSPELLECRDLELAVPGTYRAGNSYHC